MELELALAPPNPIHIQSIPDEPKGGFDLNDSLSAIVDPRYAVSNKRVYDKAFQNTIQTLNLLWNDHSRRKTRQRHYSPCNSLNQNPTVGWPPIKSSWRKRHDHGGWCSDESPGVGFGHRYVKVNMEGVAIGRKLDLNLHSTYDTLATTLQHMFGKYHKSSKRGAVAGEVLASYKLTYEDQEGDWMLVGDVPWETFVKLVKRLKIQKTGN